MIIFNIYKMYYTLQQFTSKGEIFCTLVEEIRQELKCQKELNANLQLQFKKTQDANS